MNKSRAKQKEKQSKQPYERQIPLPIDDSVHEPYPIDDGWPECLAMVIKEVAGKCMYPIEMAGTSCLTAISTASQSLSRTQRLEGLNGSAALYLLAIADSGDRKTSCDELFLRAIEDYARSLESKNSKKVNKYNSKVESWEAAKHAILTQLKKSTLSSEDRKVNEKALKKHELKKPKAPLIPDYIYKNFTIESVNKGLSKWPSIVIACDEAGSLFGGYLSLIHI